ARRLSAVRLGREGLAKHSLCRRAALLAPSGIRPVQTSRTRSLRLRARAGGITITARASARAGLGTTIAPRRRAVFRQPSQSKGDGTGGAGGPPVPRGSMLEQPPDPSKPTTTGPAHSATIAAQRPRIRRSNTAAITTERSELLLGNEFWKGSTTTRRPSSRA